MSEGRYLGEGTGHWVGLLASDDPLERRLGAYALGEIGPAATDAVPALQATLDDPIDFVRVWAADALVKAGGGEEPVQALIDATGGERDFVRSLAAWFLGRIGPGHPGIDAAVPALQGLLHDDDPSVRTEADVALGRLERPA